LIYRPLGLEPRPLTARKTVGHVPFYTSLNHHIVRLVLLSPSVICFCRIYPICPLPNSNMSATAFFGPTKEGLRTIFTALRLRQVCVKRHNCSPQPKFDADEQTRSIRRACCTSNAPPSPSPSPIMVLNRKIAPRDACNSESCSKNRLPGACHMSQFAPASGFHDPELHRFRTIECRETRSYYNKPNVGEMRGGYYDTHRAYSGKGTRCKPSAWTLALLLSLARLRMILLVLTM
jgi:hypothetical protein